MSQCGLHGSGLSLLERITQRGLLSVLNGVANRTGVHRSLILSRRRTAPIARARHELCVELRTHHRLSYPEIGYLLDRDHTTVMYACRKVAP